jgi:serine/threonine protein kinase/tetratricopeptide (TPR) repeat protein
MIGRTVSHFHVLERLGAGGMGVVYRAEDTLLRRQVALKFLPDDRAEDEEARARLRREAEAASSLDHPNICTIHEIGETEDGQIFIAMPCYEGENLAARIARGPLPIEEVIGIGEQVARGLVAAHAGGFVHRDLKPGNIFLTRDGGAKILDFGLVKRSDSSRLTQAGTTVGTIQYMSPEQVLGQEAGPASDLWALGCVLYEAVTGRPPFRAELASAAVHAILGLDPTPLTAVRTGVPPELERIVTKALRKESRDRYRHADDFEADLRSIRMRLEHSRAGQPASTSGDTTVAAAIPPPPEDAQRQQPRRFPLMDRRFGIAVALVIAVAVGAWILFGLNRHSTSTSAAPRPVAVLAFENLTGDPAYDYLGRAIPNLLITSLEQSKSLRVTTWERLQDLVRLAGNKPAEKLDLETAFELCRREGVDAVVVGSFVKAGGTFATEAKVLDTQTKELLETASARGEGPESILRSQIDALSHDIARRLAGARRRGSPAERPVIDVTTSSLEAYQEYLRGREAYEKLYSTDAYRALSRAVGLDSTFAMAQLYLAKTCSSLRMMTERRQAYRRALALSSRTTEREQLLIRKDYAQYMEGDQAASFVFLQELIRKYPREKHAYMDLALVHQREGHLREAIHALEQALALDPEYAEALNVLAYAHASLGEYDQALTYINKYVSLRPGDANPLDSLAETYFLMHRLDDAVANYQAALALRPDFIDTMWALAYVWGVRGDIDEVMRLNDRAMSVAPTPGLQARAFIYRSFFQMCFRDLAGSTSSVRRARELFRATENEVGVNATELIDCIIASRSGRWAEARNQMEAWWKRHTAGSPREEQIQHTRVTVLEGWAAIGQGDLVQARASWAEAQEVLAGLKRDAPDNTMVLQDQLTLFEAELLLAEGKPSDAIAKMRADYRFYQPHMSENDCFFANLLRDKDVVARAWLALGQIDSALVEYQHLTGDGRPRRDLYVYNYAYDLPLAKLYEQRGRRDEARAAYRRFVAYCKHADPVPDEYPEAQARLSALY